MRFCGLLLLILTYLILAYQTTDAASVLKQIHVLTRHGARTRLTKTTSGREGGASLTALGEFQHYSLGVWLRDRYSGLLDLKQYNSTLVRLESSDYDRTIVSASSLALGLFPSRRSGDTLLPSGITPANIPVHTLDRNNDIFLRSYDKCPTFQDRLQDLYQSPNWLEKERTHKELLQAIGQLDAFAQYVSSKSKGVPLSEVWNVYDAIHVARTECKNVTAVSCTNLPDPSLRKIIPEPQWEELKQLAHYAELQKYGVSTPLLGSNLLRKILSVSTVHLDRDLQDGGDFKSFYLYSAHYPTILGLLSAMGETPPTSEPVIPNYATALIVEVYHASDEGKEDYLQFIYKEGGKDDTVSTLSLNNACNGRKCPLSRFAQMVTNLPDQEEWCKACSNGSADVCMKTPSTESIASDNDSIAIAVGSFFGGIGICLVVMAGLFCRQRMALRRPNAVVEKESSNTVSLSDDREIVDIDLAEPA